MNFHFHCIPRSAQSGVTSYKLVAGAGFLCASHAGKFDLPPLPLWISAKNLRLRGQAMEGRVVRVPWAAEGGVFEAKIKGYHPKLRTYTLEYDAGASPRAVNGPKSPPQPMGYVCEDKLATKTGWQMLAMESEQPEELTDEDLKEMEQKYEPLAGATAGGLHRFFAPLTALSRAAHMSKTKTAAPIATPSNSPTLYSLLPQDPARALVLKLARQANSAKAAATGGAKTEQNFVAEAETLTTEVAEQTKDGEFDVESISKKRGRGNSLQYLVQWEGFPGEDTWEPATNVQDTEALAKFLKEDEERSVAGTGKVAAKRKDGASSEAADQPKQKQRCETGKGAPAAAASAADADSSTKRNSRSSGRARKAVDYSAMSNAGDEGEEEEYEGAGREEDEDQDEVRDEQEDEEDQDIGGKGAKKKRKRPTSNKQQHSNQTKQSKQHKTKLPSKLQPPAPHPLPLLIAKHNKDLAASTGQLKLKWKEGASSMETHADDVDETPVVPSAAGAIGEEEDEVLEDFDPGFGAGNIMAGYFDAHEDEDFTAEDEDAAKSVDGDAEWKRILRPALSLTATQGNQIREIAQKALNVLLAEQTVGALTQVGEDDEDNGAKMLTEQVQKEWVEKGAAIGIEETFGDWEDQVKTLATKTAADLQLGINAMQQAVGGGMDEETAKHVRLVIEYSKLCAAHALASPSTKVEVDEADQLKPLHQLQLALAPGVFVAHNAVATRHAIRYVLGVGSTNWRERWEVQRLPLLRQRKAREQERMQKRRERQALEAEAMALRPVEVELALLARGVTLDALAELLTEWKGAAATAAIIATSGAAAGALKKSQLYAWMRKEKGSKVGVPSVQQGSAPVSTGDPSGAAVVTNGVAAGSIEELGHTLHVVSSGEGSKVGVEVPMMLLNWIKRAGAGAGAVAEAGGTVDLTAPKKDGSDEAEQAEDLRLLGAVRERAVELDEEERQHRLREWEWAEMPRDTSLSSRGRMCRKAMHLPSSAVDALDRPSGDGGMDEGSYSVDAEVMDAAWKALEIGHTVFVASRTGPGENNPGGVGRVRKMHMDSTETTIVSFDVRYVLGGSEKKVPKRFVRPKDLGLTAPAGGGGAGGAKHEEEKRKRAVAVALDAREEIGMQAQMQPDDHSLSLPAHTHVGAHSTVAAAGALSSSSAATSAVATVGPTAATAAPARAGVNAGVDDVAGLCLPASEHKWLLAALVTHKPKSAFLQKAPDPTPPVEGEGKDGGTGEANDERHDIAAPLKRGRGRPRKEVKEPPTAVTHADKISSTAVAEEEERALQHRAQQQWQCTAEEVERFGSAATTTAAAVPAVVTGTAVHALGSNSDYRPDSATLSEFQQQQYLRRFQQYRYLVVTTDGKLIAPRHTKGSKRGVKHVWGGGWLSRLQAMGLLTGTAPGGGVGAQAEQGPQKKSQGKSGGVTIVGMWRKKGLVAPAPVVQVTSIVNMDWVQCDECDKWRCVPTATVKSLAKKAVWTCAMNEWEPDLEKRSCSAAQDPRHSAYHGVAFDQKSGKFEAHIELQVEATTSASGVDAPKPKCRFLGLFDSDLEAARAYDSAAKRHHGESAVLNFEMAVVASEVEMVVVAPQGLGPPEPRPEGPVRI
jgi:hypothetical protein